MCTRLPHPARPRALLPGNGVYPCPGRALGRVGRREVRWAGRGSAARRCISCLACGAGWRRPSANRPGRGPCAKPPAGVPRRGRPLHREGYAAEMSNCSQPCAGVPACAGLPPMAGRRCRPGHAWPAPARLAALLGHSPRPGDPSAAGQKSGADAPALAAARSSMMWSWKPWMCGGWQRSICTVPRARCGAGVPSGPGLPLAPWVAWAWAWGWPPPRLRLFGSWVAGSVLTTPRWHCVRSHYHGPARSTPSLPALTSAVTCGATPTCSSGWWSRSCWRCGASPAPPTLMTPSGQAGPVRRPSVSPAAVTAAPAQRAGAAAGPPSSTPAPAAASGATPVSSPVRPALSKVTAEHQSTKPLAVNTTAREPTASRSPPLQPTCRQGVGARVVSQLSPRTPARSGRHRGPCERSLRPDQADLRAPADRRRRTTGSA